MLKNVTQFLLSNIVELVSLLDILSFHFELCVDDRRIITCGYVCFSFSMVLFGSGQSGIVCIEYVNV